MDYLYGIINSTLENATDARLVFLLLTGLAVLVVCLGIGFMVMGLSDPLRLKMMMLRKQAHGNAGNSANDRLMAKSSRTSLSESIAPKEGWQDSKTQVRLTNAGFRNSSAVADYYAIRFLLILLLPTIALGVTQFMPEMDANKIASVLVFALLMGIILPSYVLDKLIARRQRALRNAFPDALDMLVVCVEAGLGLQMALQRVADEIHVSHPVLADELHQVNNETRVGIDRIQALRNMAIRTGLEDIRGLVASLDQSVRFGTSIADTLRVYSDEFRDKRLQRAEELAAKIATKMIFPLTFCLWPSFFLVMVGPAVLGVLAVLATR
ncbi:type II secretion system F family protein [Aliamphritea hakodatensis]|uniref:type II secretion system F family protein n=1 Tax=Aliamphritea hakodatensis TaxID=2895352 RepID=UPI0022FD9AB3|nr:type II secretion system F family protein [Aliamphritea hakodatensis]